MSLRKWAEDEVKIACEKERGNCENEYVYDYGVACYESALKAFNSLLDDNHSGMSIQCTKYILNRLIDGKCLTPIEDTEDMWNKSDSTDAYTRYQCKRMSSLFKTVYNDGSVIYNDVDRVSCVDIHNNILYHSGFVSNIVNRLYPIEMPYCAPSESYKVYCEDFLTDKKNGDFDTIGIFYMITLDGAKKEINKYYKQVGEELIEIDIDEYNERKALAKGGK